jgi:hypothetical protein
MKQHNETSNGKWIERSPMYLSFDIFNCDYCGKNIPRSIWLENIENKEVPFCSPEIAQVYIRTRKFPENERKSDCEMSLSEELRVVRAGCAALRDRRDTSTQ